MADIQWTDHVPDQSKTPIWIARENFCPPPCGPAYCPPLLNHQQPFMYLIPSNNHLHLVCTVAGRLFLTHANDTQTQICIRHANSKRLETQRVHCLFWCICSWIDHLYNKVSSNNRMIDRYICILSLCVSLKKDTERIFIFIFNRCKWYTNTNIIHKTCYLKTFRNSKGSFLLETSNFLKVLELKLKVVCFWTVSIDMIPCMLMHYVNRFVNVLVLCRHTYKSIDLKWSLFGSIANITHIMCSCLTEQCICSRPIEIYT